MGKVYSIYLTDEQETRLKDLVKEGYTKSAAIKILLLTEDLKNIIIERTDRLAEDLNNIKDLLRDIRAAPILQVGAKTPVVTVEVPKPKKVGFWRGLFKRRRGEEG